MTKAATNTLFDVAEIQTPWDSENDLCSWSFEDAQLFPATWHARISELEVSGSCDQNWTWCQKRQASKSKVDQKDGKPNTYLRMLSEFQLLPVLKRWPKKIEMVEMNPTYCNTATLKVILCNDE